MKALDKKLLRDLGRLTGQIVTISLVVACGIASYVAVIGTYQSLMRARDRYYEAQRFGEVFADLTRAPNALRGRLLAIPGVARIDTRIIAKVRLPLAGVIEPARGEAASVDAEHPMTLDALRVVEGRLPDPGRSDELTVLDSFAKAHGLSIGMRLPIVLEGIRRDMRIVGRAISPDYVFPMAPGTAAFDPSRYGVVWMDEDVLARAERMEGSFNHVSLQLQPSASLRGVIDAVDRLLAPYGGFMARARDKHPSNAMVEGELAQLSSMATVVPTIFLGVAAFLVNVVLARLVQLERPEIAALKAMGYADRALGFHYLKLVAVIVLLGALTGLGMGAYFGGVITNLYKPYFALPDLSFRLDARLFFQALFVSIGAAVLGALVTARGVMRLSPAEAMRPPAPLSYRRGFLARLGLSRLLSPSSYMVQRELARHPLRTALSVTGIALAVAVLVVGTCWGDAIDHLMDVQFRLAQTEDVAVTFVRAVPVRAAAELSRLPGVLQAAHLRVMPVRIRSQQFVREVVLSGFPDDQSLRRIVAGDGQLHVAPRHGLMLTRKLADILHVAAGDRVRVEVLDGERQLREVAVESTVDDLFGLNAYMESTALARLFDEQPLASIAMLKIDPSGYESLIARLIAQPSVLAIDRKTQMLKNFEEQTAEQTRVMTVVLSLFAAVIAAGVIYNNARVSLSVRARDLASLRVLGFRRSEISAILLWELAIQTLLALAPGMYLGRQLALWMMSVADPELFRLPVVVSPHTYAFAAVVTLTAALASALVVRRKLDRLDLIGVLKTRE